MIEGIKIVDLMMHHDDRGRLYEVVHDYDLVKFGQTYIVENPTPFAIRAYHRHEFLWDYFCIVRGRAIFCLVGPDGRECRRLVLDAGKPQLLTVPPGVWHGWTSLVPGTILLSIGSELYSQEHPDEVRVPYDTFDDLFNGSPWRIRPK